MRELTNLVISLMRKQGRGCIIYNSSVLGLVEENGVFQNHIYMILKDPVYKLTYTDSA